MSRRNGPPRGSRRKVMWFVLWARQQPRCPTAAEIAKLVDVSLNTARLWRNDWLLIRGLPAPSEKLEATS